MTRNSANWLDYGFLIAMMAICLCLGVCTPDPKPFGVAESTSDDDVRVLSQEEMLRVESGEYDVGEGKFGALPSRASWIAEFNKTRRQKIKEFPLCQACGRSPEEAEGHIDMHYIVSVERIITEKLDRGLLTQANNMIMLCRGEQSNCHFHFGHTLNGHSSWAISNPHVARDAARNFAECWEGWTYQELVDDWRKKQPVKPPKIGKNVASKTLIAP